MIKFFFINKISLLFLIICLYLFTHSVVFANTAQSSNTSNKSSEITIDSWDDLRALTADQKQQLLILLGFYFFMIVVKTTHQFVVLVRRPVPKLNINNILKKRAQNNLPSTASPEDNQLAMDLIIDGTKKWKKYKNDDGETVLLPTKTSHIRRIKKNINKIKEILPTDNEVIDFVNNHISLINSEEKRTFVGSKIIFGFLILLVPFTLLETELPVYARIIFFVVLAVFSFHYFCDYRVPRYKLRQRNEKYQLHNISSRALVYLLNQVAMAKVYKITTFWSDGRQTERYDYTEVFVQLLILIMGMVVVFILFPFMMFIHYIRNYLI